MDEASTITMIGSLNIPIDIQLAFELLSVLYPKNPDGSKYIHPENTRNKIPFFGVNNAIVCAKYKGKIRGIRENKGQMNNVVSIDLQISNKNVNIKLAKTKVQITGANSEVMGNKAFEVLCNHLNMVQSHLDHIRCLTENVRLNTLNFILENAFNLNSHGRYVSVNYDLVSKSATSHQIDEVMACFLWQFNEESENILQKFQRVIQICYSIDHNVCHENVCITDSRICNSVYNYSLNREVSLIDLTNFLNRKGFSVSFHNWSTTHLKVTMREEDDVIEDKFSPTRSENSGSSLDSENGNKIKATRFSCFKKLSIKQTSPTSHKRAMETKSIFLTAVNEFLHQLDSRKP